MTFCWRFCIRKLNCSIVILFKVRRPVSQFLNLFQEFVIDLLYEHSQLWLTLNSREVSSEIHVKFVWGEIHVKFFMWISREITSREIHVKNFTWKSRECSFHTSFTWKFHLIMPCWCRQVKKLSGPNSIEVYIELG